MTKHYQIQVKGKVQGVFYRASAKEKAIELGIKGFVLNEPDGSVYLEAEGTEEQLRELVTWCKQGPPHARVDDVEVKEAAVVGFVRFEIER